MKSVLISIKPKWVERIYHKFKIMEVRKSKPNLRTPFKCYIYCTKERPFNLMHETNLLNGKVIGEFICDNILKYECSSEGFGELATTCGTCLTYDDILDYCGGQDLYGWFITDLKIYDTPKDITYFGLKKSPQSWCYVEDFLL